MKPLFHSILVLLIFDIFIFAQDSNRLSNDLALPGRISFPELFSTQTTATRPDNLPYEYISPEGQFKLHYTLEGYDAVSSESTNPDNVPDWIYYAAQYADRAYYVLMDSIGFEPPPTDTIDGEQFDIYFLELGNGNYGYSVYGATPNYSTIRDDDYYSFLKIDNNLIGSGYTTTEYEALKITIAHEFFHCVQVGYRFDTSNYLENMNSGDTFFLEWSSVWFEEFCYPKVNDYIQYSSAILYSMDTPLWYFSKTSAFAYGQGIFMKFIIDTYSTDILLRAWNKIKDGKRAFYAIQDVIDEKTNTTLADLYNEFCQRMYFSGDNYDPDLSVSDDAQYFTELQIGWNDRYVYDSELTISDNLSQFTTLPIQITFDSSENTGILKDGGFSDDMVGRYVLDQNGKYTTAEFDLDCDHFIEKCSPGDTLYLFITNKDEEDYVSFEIQMDAVGSEGSSLFTFSNLFPNPTDGNGTLNLTISTESINDDVTVRIFNLLGQKLFSKQYNYQADHTYSIAFENDIPRPIASGIYLLQVESDNKSKTKKFTIVK